MQEFHTVSESRRLFDPVLVRAGIDRLQDFFKTQLALQNTSAFLWSPIGLGIGIIIYFSLSFEPPVFWGYGMLGFVFFGFLFLKSYERFRPVLFCLLLIALGFTLAQFRTASVYTPILTKKMGPVDVTGTIHSLEHFPGGEAVRVILEAVDIEKLEDYKTPRMVRIKLRDAGGLQAGQRIQVLAGLNPPSPPVLPGGFDFQRYMYFKGIGAVGFGYGQADILEQPEDNTWRSALQNFRSHVVLTLSQRLEGAGGVAGALLVGHKAGITEEDKEAMRAAGLAHMLAISGLHIGLFFGVVFFTIRLLMASFPALALHYPIKKYAAVLAMIAAVFYMMVAGATIPTQRAVLMTGVVFVAILMNRTPLSMRLVAFAALVILFLAPESLLSASFQMSFAAVAGLVAFYNAIRPYWSAWHSKAGFFRRAGLYVLGVSFTTIIATLATAPFALFHFQQLAVYSLLANILAMPLLAFIVMPAAVLFFVLLPFGLEGFSILVMGWGIERILEVAHFTSSLEHALLYTQIWPVWLFTILSMGFVWLILVQGRLRVISVSFLVVFIIGFLNIKQASVIVSSKSDLIAVQDQNGSLLFSSLQKDRFARQRWMEAYGLQDVKAQKWSKEGASEDLFCGEGGCRLQRGGHKVSILYDLSGFEEECRWADVLIAPDPLPQCKQGYTIDRFDTYRNGTYSLYLDEDIIIRNSAQLRGNRPWVAKAQRKANYKAP